MTQRRVRWRELLPEAEPGRVRRVAPRPDAAALPRLPGRLLVLDDERDGGDGREASSISSCRLVLRTVATKDGRASPSSTGPSSDSMMACVFIVVLWRLPAVCMNRGETERGRGRGGERNSPITPTQSCAVSFVGSLDVCKRFLNLALCQADAAKQLLSVCIL